jgi:hypothetical protein
MIILAPYSSMRLLTLEALRKFAPQAKLASTRSDVYAYWRVLKENWGIDDLVLIEHDIEITAEVIPAFTACDKLWCTYGYRPRLQGGGLPSNDIWDRSLGCTKLSLELQRLISLGDEPVSWDNLDHTLYNQIVLHTGSHVHGVVLHHHEPADGTWILGVPLPIVVENPVL